MYNPEIEKEKILELMKKTPQEITHTKQENFKRAVEFALDEVSEFDDLFKKFVNDVSHLEVFKDSIEGPLVADMNKMIKNLNYLIEKNYTIEEKDNMPEEVLKQVSASQEKRITLLKKVARRYLTRPK